MSNGSADAKDGKGEEELRASHAGGNEGAGIRRKGKPGNSSQKALRQILLVDTDPLEMQLAFKSVLLKAKRLDPPGLITGRRSLLERQPLTPR
jgi:hypothetical protein